MKALIDSGDGGTALAVTRSLGRNGIKVTALAKKKQAVSFYSKYCKHSMIYPSPFENPDKFVNFMLKQVKNNNYDILFTMGNPEMNLISINRDKFLPHTKIHLVDHPILEKANDKSETIQIAMENNIPCPQTYFPQNIDDIRELKEKVEYPVVIKPRKSTGSKGLVYVDAPERLVPCYKKVISDHKFPIIQEYIPPGGDTYGFEALYNKDSRLRAFFVHKRIREYPITGGPSTLRESVRNSEIEKLSKRLLDSLNWYGLAMVEFKVDPRDKKPKLMEINPRFWGSLPLAIASGVDFPYLLFRMVTEGDIKPVLNYRTGVKCRWLLFGDIKHLLSVMKGHSNNRIHPRFSRVNTLINFLKFYQKDLHYDFISLDDPKPTLFKLFSPLLQKLS